MREFVSCENWHSQYDGKVIKDMFQTTSQLWNSKLHNLGMKYDYKYGELQETHPLVELQAPQVNPMKPQYSSLPMTDPAGAGTYANMTGVFVDGIHGAPYIAAPSCHGSVMGDISTALLLVGGIPTLLKNMKVKWGYCSQYMESHKSHVPNHQRDILLVTSLWYSIINHH